MSERTQIRCCCNPNLVLGSVPTGRIPERYRVPLRVVGLGGVGEVVLESHRFAGQMTDAGGDVIERIDSIALKSDDLPAYVAVYIEGFEPCKSDSDFDEPSLEVFRELEIKQGRLGSGPRFDQIWKAIAWIREHGRFFSTDWTEKQ